MKLQLLPAHQERARWGWGARGAPAGTPCSAGLLLDVPDGESEASTFGIPNSLGGSHSSHPHLHCSSTSPPNLFPLLSPWLLAGDSQMVAHECQGPPFLGRQQRGTAHGLCTQGLAEQGRGHGAWSGYNLGTINRGSKGSCFLFSFYPLQCLC